MAAGGEGMLRAMDGGEPAGTLDSGARSPLVSWTPQSDTSSRRRRPVLHVLGRGVSRGAGSGD